MAQFALFSPRLKALEGGYVVDSGGPTNWGITLSTLRDFRKNPGLTAADVKRLTWPEASTIYRSVYWNSLLADGIKSQSIAELLVDWKINGWPGLAAVQRLIGASADGRMGPATLAAINGQSGPVLHARLWLARKGYYNGLIATNPTRYAQYARGWTRRLHSFVFTDVAATGISAGVLVLASLTTWWAVYRKRRITSK